MIFVSGWTLILLPYLTLAPRVWEGRFAIKKNKFVVLALDGLTMVGWLGGFIALAVWGDDFAGCKGSGSGACKRAMGVIVLGALEWYVFFLSFLFVPANSFMLFFLFFLSFSLFPFLFFFKNKEKSLPTRL